MNLVTSLIFPFFTLGAPADGCVSIQADVPDGGLWKQQDCGADCFHESPYFSGEKEGFRCRFLRLSAFPRSDKAGGSMKCSNSPFEKARANSWRSITVRGNAPFADDIPKGDSYYRHVLSLKKNENELYRNFRNSTQRNIKKAIKSEVSVSFESTRDAVQHFYRLNCLSRKTHGLPPQPHFFFDHFFREIIEKGHGEVALARYKGRVASALVFFHFGTVASYKYGASDAAMSNTRANYLVMWKVSCGITPRTSGCSVSEGPRKSMKDCCSSRTAGVRSNRRSITMRTMSRKARSSGRG